MADIEGTNIYSLTTRAKATITDDANAWIPYEDRSGDPADTFKMSIDDLLSGLSVVATPEVVAYSASHGLTSGAVGKPIGWKADGKPYVWTDTGTTEIPVAVVQDITDTDHIQIAAIGPLTEIANTLLPASMPVYSANTNSRMLFWDTSAGTYKHVTQGDSTRDMRLVYWIGLKEGDASTSVCMVMPPGVDASPKTVVANVRDFGAQQDGTTDDRTAIQAAIDSNRPIVYFPGSPSSTVYYISDYLTLNNDRQKLVGDGPSSIIHCDDEDSCVIYVVGTSAADRLVGCSISNLWIQGAAATVATPAEPTSTANGVGIRAYYCHQLEIFNCLVSHCNGHGINLYKCGAVDIHDNWFFSQYFEGGWSGNADVFTNDENLYTTVRDNHCLSNCKLHIYLAGNQCVQKTVVGNVCMACDDNGEALIPAAGVNNSDSGYSVVQHNLALCYWDNVNTGYNGRAIVTDNLCWAGRWSNIYYNSAEDGVGLDDVGMRVIVANNICIGGAWCNDTVYGSPTLSGAINIWAGREVLIHGNLVLDAKCNPFANPAIRAVMLQDQGFYQITQNIVSNAFCGGIYLDGVAARHVVAGNYLANCGGRAYYPLYVYTAETAANSAKTVTAIDTGTNVITSNSHGFLDGERIRFAVSGGSYFSVDGVVVDSKKLFYVRDKDTNTFKIAETPGGSALDITATYSGTLTATHIQYQGGNLIHDNIIVCDLNQKTSDPVEFAASAVDVSTNRITLTNHGITGASIQKIVFNNATPANLFAISSSTVTNGTVYYGKYVDANTFEVSATYGGSAADITSAGTGTHSMRLISESPGGLYYHNANEIEPTSIKNNVIISSQPQSAGYGTVGYGLVVTGTSGKIICNNLVSGFLTGIYLPTSHTARAVESIQIDGNYLRNNYYQVYIVGSVDGLVLVNDSNRYTGSGPWRVYQSNAGVGVPGVLRNGKIFAAMPYIGAKSATTNSTDTFSSTSHGFSVGDRVQLSGTIPTNFSAGTNYWVVTAAASTFKLASTRTGSAITAGSTVSSGLTVTHHLPNFGTWAVGDTIINESWDDQTDPREWVCTTAGAIGTCVWRQMGGKIATLTAADTTPDVTNIAVAITANTGSTTITGLDGGTIYQKLTVVANDTFTTLKHSGAAGSEIPFALIGNQDRLLIWGDVVELMRIDVSGSQYWREVGLHPEDLLLTATPDDATPSVRGIRTLVTANANPTTITNFDDGYNGQQLTLIVNDANTTLDHNASATIILASGADETCSSGDVFEFVRFGGKWYEKTTTATT